MSKHLIPAHAEVKIDEKEIIYFDGGAYCPRGHYTRLGSVYTFMQREFSDIEHQNFDTTRVWLSNFGKVISLGGDNTSHEWAGNITPLLERLEYLESKIAKLEGNIIGMAWNKH